MGKLLEFFKGKKTYLVAFSAILTAFIGWVSGTITVEQFIAAVFAAIGTMTMRGAIAKVEK